MPTALHIDIGPVPPYQAGRAFLQLTTPFGFPTGQTANHAAIRNSGTFYFSDAVNNWDWTDPQNPSLWQDAVKTLFDPCPAGWRVPQCGESERSPWIYLCEDRSGGGIPYATELSFTEGSQGGFHFYRNGTPGPTAWHPASGSRYGSQAVITNSGAYGYWRSSTMAVSQTVYFLTIVPTTVFPYDNAIETASCASALSVRCIRE